MFEFEKDKHRRTYSAALFFPSFMIIRRHLEWAFTAGRMPSHIPGELLSNKNANFVLFVLQSLQWKGK